MSLTISFFDEETFSLEQKDAGKGLVLDCWISESPMAFGSVPKFSLHKPSTSESHDGDGLGRGLGPTGCSSCGFFVEAIGLSKRCVGR